MWNKVFQTFCVYCGKTCFYSQMLCDDCVSNLKKVTHICRNCGRSSKTDVYYCVHCKNKGYINRYYSDYKYSSEMRLIFNLLKYYFRIRGANQLGKLIIIPESFLDVYDIIVPVPYHFLRLISRPVNPVNILCKELVSLGFKVEKILKRKKYTQYQSRLSKTNRVSNIKGAFECKKLLSGEKVLIIDDLVTSGATVLECAKILKKAGAGIVDVYSLASV